jgi:Ca2+:H+ antiporter
MTVLLVDERFLIVAIVVGALAYGFEPTLLQSGQPTALIASVVLVVAIVAASMRVARHAENIAERMLDPYGTMILTLSAVLVEVVILGIMMAHEASPTLVRDTIYSAVMLDINGVLGLAALMGGFKHGEQSYNDDSGRIYSVMILTAMGISMVVPEFIPTSSWRSYSSFTIFVMLTLYTVFLRMQTGPHSYFFSYTYPEKRRRPQPSSVPLFTVQTKVDRGPSRRLSIVALIAGLIVIGAIAEVMSKTLNVGMKDTGAPPGIVALLVATISAAPEIMTALRAGLANRMQSVVNIALGASLSTVILTVPLMEALALFSGQAIQMAMSPVQTVMVFLTLIVAAINLNDGQTNAIEGMAHFVLFATFLMLTTIGL